LKAERVVFLTIKTSLMRNLLLSFSLIYAQFLFSQESWTKEELKVLETFGLDSMDHRGVIFLPSQQNDAASMATAIHQFFTTISKKDLTEIPVKNEEFLQPYFGQPLDIHQVVKLYLTQSK